MPETPREREIRMENASLFEAWRHALPDSRLREVTGQIPSPLGLLTPIFCMNCGRGCGAVYGDTPFTHALCDPCGDRWGGLPGIPSVRGTVGPDGLVHFNQED